MYDTVHVDEKWCYIQKVSSTFILTEDEDTPHISCPNKRYITKVMFLAAVARPRYDYKRPACSTVRSASFRSCRRGSRSERQRIRPRETQLAK
ncbi:TPA: hypothetical protein N0F65_008047 [Lagenidium giganteum]|uniref:Transposase n=1 Tax=Lagenidium giganteum TaxID=4803 RepID=A0AAV2YIB0_9STRA|nr:TPA: hypothetical protein N0F65_008047 [Lagenidium giganteum]